MIQPYCADISYFTLYRDNARLLSDQCPAELMDIRLPN